ncbi:erythropoietin receptor isoform X1 [Bufo bufo]|uniref:erythropoietin receptor isoform X1 n=1 Tax=Bufo bufo TaxID=8384 RepID=UPI001ABDF910|nr:erythropoietin receptor isoform X1 [Bufo bufo]XP_040270943.1 erythropoietin receptor isoform X1 [Bufo bufo]
MNGSGKSQALYCGCLLSVMWVALCNGTENKTTLASLISDVYSVIENKSVIPFCFTNNLYELTCFWKSNSSDASSYNFTYTPEEKTCKLTTAAASDDIWWHICQFRNIDLFSLTPYHITVEDKLKNCSFSRDCRAEHVVYLEPIKNIEVKEQWRPLGLWLILNHTYPDLLALTYEVKYMSEKSNILKTETFPNIRGNQGDVKLFLDDIVGGAEYTFSVRVKADEEYDGYWSQWTDVHVQIANAVDPFHVMMYVIAGLIPIVAIVMLATCQRRFLKTKVWPEIPSPEHHFKELYTTHKGNFKLWLDQTDSYLIWISRNIFHEGPISTLEVLSELPNVMPQPAPSAQLPPKDSYVTLDESFLPHFPAWMVTQRQLDIQMELLIPGETLSQENTCSNNGRSGEDEREMSTEEVPPVEERKSHLTKGKPGCLTIQREDSLSSEEGKQSAGSSFEYTVLETCDGLLSPRTRSIPQRQPLKYAYLAMSESGEESPPASPNIYQNSICAQRPAHIYSQC